MKILVVEDEPKTGKYLRKGLTESGFAVDLARTGTEGELLALSGEYDLIVLDVMLPGINNGVPPTVLRTILVFAAYWYR
jgi:two-component system copper resistance phosphate regulon response regulator CusR